MGYFIPIAGIVGPELTVQEVCLDSEVEKAFEMAQEIDKDEVTCYFNGSPGFRTTTTREQRAIYVLARALQVYAKAYEAMKANHEKL